MIGAWKDGPNYPFSAYGIPYTVMRVAAHKYTVGVRQTAYDTKDMISFNLESEQLTNSQEVHKVAELFKPHLVRKNWPYIE